METRMTQPLSVYEKQALLKRFDLSDLSASDQQAFHSLLFDYLNEFPVMNEIAREVIDTGFRSIHITIQDDMAGAVGSQYGNNINFDTKYWDRHAFSKQGRNRLAATFWHEALHYLQEKKLPAATSKRAHIIYRQFIEAEANSISNLIRPDNRFEAELYRVALKKFKNLEAAQRYYLGISSRLRLHADRDLAKNEAKNIMGSSFSDHLWHDSEKSAVKHWRDFYYKYHNSHIARGGYKSIFFKKTKYDADIIRKMEDYFFNKYGKTREDLIQYMNNTPLYTKEDCPRCDMLKAKLNAKNIAFAEIKDEATIEALGIDFLPVLQVGDSMLKLSEANDFINSL